ncbi:MAG: tetratricopeptide repeat protein [Caldilineaceae bacterium]
MAELSLYLFGAPRIVLDGAEIYIRRRKAVALLAYLAVTQQPHSRDALATLLWPDYNQTGARDNLRRNLSALHQALDGNWLAIDRSTIRLRDDTGLWVDVWQFQSLLAACQQHGHPKEQICPACIPLLQQAAELYCNDFLTGFTLADSPDFDDWQAYTTAQLRSALAMTLVRLLNGYADQRDYAKAIDYARRWVTLDPLHEPAHRRLMELYAQNDQQSAALRQYEECRQTLADELAIAPAPETMTLYAQIRDRVIGPAATRLPTAMIQRPLHNLPAQTTSLIGRAQAVAEVQRLLLNEPGCRLLNLVGPGGIGKTRLALAAAAQVVDAFPDGVFFVPFAPVGEVNAIVPAIAETLHFTFYSSSTPTEQLLDYLRQKKLLLVLDNFEHLLPGADLLTTLLRHSPNISLLTTARERLHLQEEWVYAVEGLAFPLLDAGDPMVTAAVDRADAYSAVQLFVQRARQTNATFHPAPTELAAIGRICRLVGGMPLGIELAAPWIRTLSCTEIAAEIAHSLDFLTTTLRNVPERHRSLRVLFAQTWQRLFSAEQAALMRLSVLRGGCTRDAAEAIAGITMLLLTALVDKALLRRTAQGRYELHELIRQFAAVKLDEAAQTAVARNQHLRYYMDWAEAVEPQLRVGPQVAQWYTQLEAEHDNLRAALAWACNGGEFQDGLRLVSALYDFWVGRGYLHEGYAQAERFLAHPAAAAAPVAERARALLTAGALAANWHNYHLARPLLIESETMARELGAAGQFTLARACIELSWTTIGLLDFAAAQRYGDEGLRLGHALDDAWVCGQARIVLGAVANDQGDYATAQQHFAAAIECCQPLGVTLVYGSALNSLGYLLSIQGDYPQAQAHLAQSIAIFDALGNQAEKAWSLFGLGEIAAAQNLLPAAEQYYQQALSIQRTLNDYDHTGNTLEAIGRLAQRQGDYARAATVLQESLALRVKMGYRPALASVLEAFALLVAAQGQAEWAVQLLGAADILLQHALRTPIHQAAHDRLVATLRTQLGEPLFSNAWAAGADRKLDEIIESL